MFENLLGNIQSTITFIAVLSILILVHEWGHFITAKKLGVKIEEFSLGFGPKLYSRIHNGTEYLIKLIPLGGYVKMEGDERVKCKGKEGEFYSKPVGHRALIVLNGPIVNYLLAYLCLTLVFMIGYPGFSSRIEDVTKGSPAYNAGIKIGDEILEIDSRKVYGWRNIESLIIDSKNDEIEVKALRNGKEIVKRISPKIEKKVNVFGQYENVRDIGISAFSNTIGALVEGYPAYESGLDIGDKIIQIDSKRINGWTDLQETIANTKNEKINIKILRNGKELTTTIVPKVSTIKDESGEEKEVRQIGIAPIREFGSFKFGLIDSLKNAFIELSYITKLTLKSLYFMITGAMSAKESVTGPIGIFFIVKSAAELGISHLLFILGVISASLAIFNLLPMIPLDGGHLFLFGIEKVRGKALSPKVDDYITRTGLALLIVLALFVFYSDFSRYGWIDKITGFFRK